MVDETQIQTAAIVFPIMVLITNFAINSVTPDDGRTYRVFVGGMGIVTLVTSMIAAGLLFVGGLTEVEITTGYSYLVASVVIVFCLALGIMVHEISRGLETDGDKMYVFVGVGVFVAVAIVAVNVL